MLRSFCRKLTPVRAHNLKALLFVEFLESRLAPAVVGVDTSASVHAIDPNIYGSAFATTAQIQDLRLTLNRDGGNASDTYSYAQDATNHGSDWYFESIASGSGNGQGMDQFVSSTKSGGAQPSLTLNLFNWAAKNATSSTLGSFPVSTYGAQQSTDPFNSNLGNGVSTSGTNITGNDPNIAYVANSPTIEKAWIQHLVATFGNSQNGGVKYYTLGNEPALWNSTHRDIHPNGETNTELLNDIINYASMVKSVDPGAQILGPEEWGWTGYFIDGADAAAQNWGATYGGLNVQQWLLQQLDQYQQAHGTRLLDYFTLHFYPQGGEDSNDVSTATELLRNQSTRSLWDPNYVDQSWIASTGINGGKVDLINQMKSWVNTYYPGTKLGITEYNWGAEGNMNGATTQADIWGIFGREGLDLSDRWTTPATGSPTYLAMKMFRNYDGNGGAFGDTSVSASVANPDQVDAFASKRSSDGALTVMVINKNLYDSSNPSATTPITINLSNFASTGTAQEWQLAAINPSDQTKAAITQLSNVAVSGNSITVNVPMESVTMFVLEPASTAAAPPTPTGLMATPGNASVTLSWNASNGATGYNVYRSTSTGTETLLKSGVQGTTFSDTGLTNGTTYFYKVSAVNGAGESPLSLEVSAMPQAPIVAPPTPTGVMASAGDASVAISWSASSGATGYNVYRSTSTGTETLLKSDVQGTTFSDTGLTNSTTYFYKVSAINGAGESALSSEVSATPQASPPAAPPTPTGLTATPGDASDELSWNASIGATSYNVYRSTSTGTETLLQSGVQGTTFSDTNLTNGATYFYKVSAVNAGGESALSGEVSATPQAPPTNTHGLAATYYASSNFTGATVSEIDPTINFNWGNSSPVAGIGGGNFSAVWTGQVQAVASGKYRFQTNSADGVRLWVNGQLLINDWKAHGPKVDTSLGVNLTAGQKYDIKVQYYDSMGGAEMQLLWRLPGQTAFGVIPQAQLYLPSTTGTGLQATYYSNNNLTGTKVYRKDTTVNFNWTGHAPASGIGPDNFSALWTGQVLANQTGTYTFRTISDAGVRLWVNGQLVINDWSAHGTKSDTGKITLQAGQKYNIKLEYYQDTGTSVMRLEWMLPGQSTFAVIPQVNLFS
jgi:fibronectin type 3 domain-containing protein